MEGMSLVAMNPAKFDPFTIHTTHYKVVNGHPIEANVLVHKNIKAGKRPLIVRFHGGLLVTGASLVPLFFQNWVLELAALESAIIVSADYRLLPESTGADMLQDIADLWTWVKNDLPAYLASTSTTASVDPAHVLVCGESAGGYLAFQSALTQPAGTIQAVVGMYPALDMRSDFITQKFDKPVFGMPTMPEGIIDAHLAATAPGAVVSSVFPPARLDLATAILQSGRMLEFLGTDEALIPVEAVTKVKSMPAVLILHGKDDSALPTVGSEIFVKKLKETLPNTPVRLDIQPGDHGFDGEATLETDWLKEDVKFIRPYWLA